MAWYDYVIIIIYLLNTLLMFIYGLHYYLIAYLYYRKKKERILDSEPLLEGDFPKVTIQLPIFNELYVAERLIRKVMAINYPKDRFEVHVLDDSIDETQDICKKLVAEYQKSGYRIEYLHREDRVDHKAGALREALAKAEGDYITIFDSDFLPPEDFLLKTLPHFSNSDIGMVQTRWGHLNQDYSILTKAQSLAIDSHFVLEQSTRSDYGLWLNFNGTAGVWRKSCIEDAGNWQGDTLTEDLDLSYRAQLRGWRFIFLQDVVSPAELPVEMTSYKAQQFRWAKGSLQTAIKLIGQVIRSPYPLRKKLEGIIHLTYYSVHPLMLFNLLWTLPLISVQHRFFQDFSLMGYPVATLIGMVFMILGTSAPSFFLLYTQRELTGSWTKRLRWLPYMFLAGLGIAIHITKAFLEAVFRKKSSFIRTPKFDISVTRNGWFRKQYTIPIDFITVLELAAAVYAMIVTYYAFSYGIPLAATFPILFAISFSYVGLTAIFQRFRRKSFMVKAEKVTTES